VAGWPSVRAVGSARCDGRRARARLGGRPRRHRADAGLGCRTVSVLRRGSPLAHHRDRPPPSRALRETGGDRVDRGDRDRRARRTGGSPRGSTFLTRRLGAARCWGITAGPFHAPTLATARRDPRSAGAESTVASPTGLVGLSRVALPPRDALGDPPCTCPAGCTRWAPQFLKGGRVTPRSALLSLGGRSVARPLFLPHLTRANP
jgi:hypothetical protein